MATRVWKAGALLLAILLGGALLAIWKLDSRLDSSRSHARKLDTRLATLGRENAQLSRALAESDAPGSSGDDVLQTIVVDGPTVTQLGGVVFNNGAIQLASFIQAYGDTAQRDALVDRCVVAWRVGLFATFVDRRGVPDPCNPEFGLLDHATLSSARWRTDQGLAVGDTIAELRRRYPKARKEQDPYPSAPHGTTWWLATNSVEGIAYPTLVAVVEDDTVTAFRVYTDID